MYNLALQRGHKRGRHMKGIWYTWDGDRGEDPCQHRASDGYASLMGFDGTHSSDGNEWRSGFMLGRSRRITAAPDAETRLGAKLS